jgi:hypothetical protein
MEETVIRNKVRVIRAFYASYQQIIEKTDAEIVTLSREAYEAGYEVGHLLEYLDSISQ